jgi:hypothetical protein
MTESGWALGGFHDLEQRDIGRGTCQLVAPGRPGRGLNQPRGDQIRHDLRQDLVGDLHLGGDLARLAQLSVGAAGHMNHGPHRIVADALQTELHDTTLDVKYRLRVFGISTVKLKSNKMRDI